MTNIVIWENIHIFGRSTKVVQQTLGADIYFMDMLNRTEPATI